MTTLMSVVLLCVSGIALTSCARLVHDINIRLGNIVKLRWRLFPYLMYVCAGYMFGCAAYMMFAQKGW